MENEGCCFECKFLIGAPVGLGPHDRLRMETAKVLAQGVEYECRTCGAKLLREEKRGDPAVLWRLV